MNERYVTSVDLRDDLVEVSSPQNGATSLSDDFLTWSELSDDLDWVSFLDLVDSITSDWGDGSVGERDILGVLGRLQEESG